MGINYTCPGSAGSRLSTRCVPIKTDDDMIQWQMQEVRSLMVPEAVCCDAQTTWICVGVKSCLSMILAFTSMAHCIAVVHIRLCLI